MMVLLLAFRFWLNSSIKWLKKSECINSTTGYVRPFLRLKYTDDAGLLPQGLILAIYQETKLPLSSAEILIHDGLKKWHCHTKLKLLLPGTFSIGLSQLPVQLRATHCLVVQKAPDHMLVRGDCPEVSEGLFGSTFELLMHGVQFTFGISPGISNSNQILQIIAYTEQLHVYVPNWLFTNNLTQCLLALSELCRVVNWRTLSR